MAEYNGFLYKKNYKDEIVITGIDDDKKYDEEINIPSEICGKKVLSLSAESFKGCHAKKIVMPNDIISIDTATFLHCERLKEVVLSNKLKSIEALAFAYCSSLDKIILPNKLFAIGNDAFKNCTALKEIYIPNSVKHIGDSIFCNCEELKKIKIGNGISSLPSTIFLGCCKLEEIVFGDHIKLIDKYTFSLCEHVKKIVIGKTTRINDDAFKNCKELEKIDVAFNNPFYSSLGGVLYDKAYATLLFYPSASPRTGYTIPKYVSFIKKDAFENCENLNNIIIDDSVKWI